MAMRNVELWSQFAKEALKGSISVAKLLCLLHVTNSYLLTPVVPYGPSMLPTLNLTGDLVLVERLSSRLGKVGPGDVILFRSPDNPRKVVIKRIVGVEGETVTYSVDPKNSDERRTVVVPNGKLWVEGDNIYASKDSRQYGAVPVGLVEGKLLWRIWPPKAFGSLDGAVQ